MEFFSQLHLGWILTIGIKGISVGVVKSLSGRKPGSRGVAVSQIVGTRVDYAGSVSQLMESGAGLILTVAGFGESTQAGEEKRAVHDVVP